VVSCTPSGQEAAVEISFFGSLACEAEVNLLQALHGGVPEGACIGVGAVPLFLAVESMVLLWIVRRARARRLTPAPADPGPIWSARAGRDGGPIR
jgi:hypothetical protein